eukprot:3651257-Amphidinium_carterae.1
MAGKTTKLNATAARAHGGTQYYAVGEFGIAPRHASSLKLALPEGLNTLQHITGDREHANNTYEQTMELSFCT